MVNSLPQVFLSLHAPHTLLPALCLWWTRKLWRCCFLPILNRSSGHPLSHALPVGVSSPPVLCRWPGRARVPSCAWHSPLARGPEDLARYIHIEPAPHDTPTTFYTRVFLHPLRFPALRALGLPDPDVSAIELATRSALLAMPLLQALDYLHTQLLSGLCVAAPPRGLIPRDKMLDPMRRQPHPVACRLTRPREALQQVLSPTFRCWLGKRISPSMTLVTLKCDSVPWANYFTQGQKGPLHVKLHEVLGKKVKKRSKVYVGLGSYWKYWTVIEWKCIGLVTGGRWVFIALHAPSCTPQFLSLRHLKGQGMENIKNNAYLLFSPSLDPWDQIIRERTHALPAGQC